MYNNKSYDILYNICRKHHKIMYVSISISVITIINQYIDVSSHLCTMTLIIYMVFQQSCFSRKSLYHIFLYVNIQRLKTYHYWFKFIISVPWCYIYKLYPTIWLISVPFSLPNKKNLVDIICVYIRDLISIWGGNVMPEFFTTYK